MSTYKVGDITYDSATGRPITSDGKFLLDVEKQQEEIKNNKLYREFKVNYKNFELDLNNSPEKLSTENLMDKAKVFFKKNGLLLNWKEFEKLDNNQKINTLSMISPVTNGEKQKLLESLTIADKIQSLENIINFYLHEVDFDNQTVQ